MEQRGYVGRVRMRRIAGLSLALALSVPSVMAVTATAAGAGQHAGYWGFTEEPPADTSLTGITQEPGGR